MLHRGLRSSAAPEYSCTPPAASSSSYKKGDIKLYPPVSAAWAFLLRCDSVTLNLHPPQPHPPVMPQPPTPAFLSPSLPAGESLSSVLHQLHDTLRFVLLSFFLILSSSPSCKRFVQRSASIRTLILEPLCVFVFPSLRQHIKPDVVIWKRCSGISPSKVVDLPRPLPPCGSGFSPALLGHLPQHRPVEPSLTLPPLLPLPPHP